MKNSFLHFTQTENGRGDWADVVDDDPPLVRQLSDGVVMDRKKTMQLEDITIDRTRHTSAGSSTEAGENRLQSTASSESSLKDADVREVLCNPYCDNVREKATESDFVGLTSVMVRGIPSKLSQRRLVKEVDSLGFARLYDFLYLPTNPRNQCNRGFAFLNLATSEATQMFFRKVNGHRIRHMDVEGELQVVPARIQGFAENVRQFDNQKEDRTGRRCHQRPIITAPTNVALRVPEQEVGRDSSGASCLLGTSPS
jgi:hypothetical protein